MVKRKWLYCNILILQCSKTKSPFQEKTLGYTKWLTAIRLCTLEELSITIMVSEGIKLGKEVFGEEGIGGRLQKSLIGTNIIGCISWFQLHSANLLWVMIYVLAIGNLPLP